MNSDLDFSTWKSDEATSYTRDILLHVHVTITAKAENLSF